MPRVDDFSKSIKESLARRVGFKCSNPKCRRVTSGPSSESTDGTVNIGVAAHITAASPGGARFDSSMPSAVRSSIENAIWCCQVCGKLVDDDESKYTVTVLKGWKETAEYEAANDLETRSVQATREECEEVLAAQQDILLGALEGHAGNMIVFGERNGWDVVSLVGEHYCTSQDERALYVEAMVQLLDTGLARRRGTGIAYELTYQGLKQAKLVSGTGRKRRRPGPTDEKDAK